MPQDGQKSPNFGKPYFGITAAMKLAAVSIVDKGGMWKRDTREKEIRLDGMDLDLGRTDIPRIA